jgi:DNA repair protein RadD
MVASLCAAMNRELYPWQAEALEALRQTIRQGVRRIVLQAPTGAGKTLLSAAIIEGALAKDRRVVFTVSHLSLIDQTIEALYAEGIRDCGVIQANHHMTDWSRPVQVASIATINSRKVLPEAHVVIIDECHMLYDAHKSWMAHPDWQTKSFIGLSATPFTKGLGKHFQTLLTVATTQDMIDKGILCPFRMFSVGHSDLKAKLKGVKVTAGDYAEGELSTVMREDEISGDVIRTYQSKWGKGKTLVFGVDCAHAQVLQERFKAVGIAAGYQDARTCMEDRRDIKRAFHNGTLDVVCNVGTLTTGVDWDIRCLALVRPTKSEILYKQIVGRALRRADGKDHAIILDHGRVYHELGFVTDIECSELDDGNSKRSERKPPLPKECASCHMLKGAGQRRCLNCGFEPTPQCDIAESDDELEEIDRGLLPLKRKKHEATIEEKADFFAQLKSYARQKSYNPGWASNKYRDKFGVWPNDPRIKHAPSQAPTPSVLSWIRHANMKWAKSKRNPGNHAGMT